ncbi:hypothetical protein DRJ12_03485 [Candidatus Acetothermia bacterium]|nr:MAG: hypothetical protein DRJ12_03485 [Candidatus Acetothermia bacterium]
MRRWVFVLGLLLLGGALSSVSMPLCNYRSPLTDLSDLSIAFSYQYHNDPYGLKDEDVNQGQFNVSYVQLYDTPQFGLDVSLQSDMSISVLDISTYTMSADGNYKRYFSFEEDYFAFAGGSARSSSSYQALGLSVNLGIGYGRFTDVTPLAKATRIDTYLVNRGTLTAHLYPVDLQALASEIGSIASYDSLADLLTAVQDIIEGSGYLSARGLDALDISEVTRLIEEEGFSRYCGWDVKAGIGYQLLDPSKGGGNVLITGALNYAFTTTPKAQFLVQGSFSGPPTILEQNRVDVTASYDYLIADFLTMSATYRFSRETWNSVPTDTHRVSFDLTLTPLSSANVGLSIILERRPYYLEWSIDIALSISMDLL